MSEPDDDSPALIGEVGWRAQVPPEDQTWVDTYGFLDFPNVLANPVDALPPGYDAYTAVFHNLGDGESEPRVRWISDRHRDPWTQVEHIVDHGLQEHRFAADCPMSQPEGQFLAEVLDLDTHPVRLTVSFFVRWSGTVPAATIAARLRSADHGLSDIPSLWFPHTRRWVASTPYDCGWTYIASDTATAIRLRSNPDVEALPCRYSA